MKKDTMGFIFLWELYYVGLPNFLIRCIFYFIVETKLFPIYISKDMGSFFTPGLNTCTILAIERKQGFQCYSEGTLVRIVRVHFLSVSSSLSKLSVPGCPQIVFASIRTRHSISGLALGNDWRIETFGGLRLYLPRWSKHLLSVISEWFWTRNWRWRSTSSSCARRVSSISVAYVQSGAPSPVKRWTLSCTRSFRRESISVTCTVRHQRLPDRQATIRSEFVGKAGIEHSKIRPHLRRPAW